MPAEGDCNLHMQGGAATRCNSSLLHSRALDTHAIICTQKSDMSCCQSHRMTASSYLRSPMTASTPSCTTAGCKGCSQACQSALRWSGQASEASPANSPQSHLFQCHTSIIAGICPFNNNFTFTLRCCLPEKQLCRLQCAKSWTCQRIRRLL